MCARVRREAEDILTHRTNDRQSDGHESIATDDRMYVHSGVRVHTLVAVQMHAELCYAEALLQSALLTVVEDESLSNFVRAALTIRHCYNSYR